MGPNATNTGRDLQVVRGEGEGTPQQAFGLLENAGRVAEDTVRQARTEADRIVGAARSEAEKVRREGLEQGALERAAADRDAERLRHEKLGEAERLLREAREEVAELERSAGRLRSERDAAADSARELATKLQDAVHSAMPHSQESHEG
jgi:vacuolar-type H+-ATPase subunit E/Vma4